MQCKIVNHFKVNYVKAKKEEALSIIMFHGYGANGEDLIPFAQAIDPDKKFNWIFPEAKKNIDFQFFGGGFTWFDFDVDSFIQNLEKGIWEVDEMVNEAELDKLSSELDELVQALGCSMDQVILGGFSQGSMVALDWGLRSVKAPMGFVLLSSSILSLPRWKERMKNKSIPIFQSHGIQDPLLPFSVAKRLNQTFLEAGWPSQFEAFEGGHEVTEPVLNGVKKLLERLNLGKK
tara:strand:- start:1345 stop:2043 length:699 start_codon:yes stop_codon:yes gene_type:complete